ncbi:IclR family transcriptional regulator [Alkalihalobacterium alkalinitrilicum]|uniref:IclR family transcriptional regulator n=1 Tax=Alkalihalobacterium alkalinitrilicum TaxID=427920 RepID=UPI001EE3F0DE|nr:IclR family transcriptional regulator [Alkalihalobacterium alkalinitrilicum]
MNEMDKNYSMKSIHRTIKILKSFTFERQSLSMTELHEITEITKPSLQRILATLVYEGFLQKDESTKKYKLGMELYFLGNLVQKDSTLLNTALPVMQRLRDETGESVTLNVIYNNKRKCIGYCESRHELTTLTFIGHDSPLHAGASAKVLLAHMAKNEVESYFSSNSFQKFNEKTIVDKELLFEELRSIQEKGYAISYGERVKGAFSISVPITNSMNQVMAGLSIVVPLPRVEEFEVDDLITLLKQGAQEISTLLGNRDSFFNMKEMN